MKKVTWEEVREWRAEDARQATNPYVGSLTYALTRIAEAARGGEPGVSMILQGATVKELRSRGFRVESSDTFYASYFPKYFVWWWKDEE